VDERGFKSDSFNANVFNTGRRHAHRSQDAGHRLAAPEGFLQKRGLMKDLFKNFIVFIALSVVFSSLLACPTKTTENGTTGETDSNTTDAKKKDDKGYPPMPSAIAQAEIKMLDGSTLKIEDKKGKVVLLNLWGTWCGPCIAEMPSLIEMQEKYKDKNFEIIGLNIGDGEGNPESEEKVKEFVEKKQLNYSIGYADRKLSNEFMRVGQMAGVPLSILVNREGKITNIFQGGGPRILNSMKETVEKTINE
jgi:thiol-disulfide isomerase/thioredoxin